MTRSPSMLVEAAWCASRTPGPLRAFYSRIKTRRGVQVAIVATARKMTAICWHLIHDDADYAFARPSLNAFKQRKLELTAGAPRQVAKRGTGYDYNDKAIRAHERQVVEAAEHAYEVLVARWQARRPDEPSRAPDHRGIADAVKT